MSFSLLLVEDEMALAVGLIDVLEVKGYRVEHAAQGQQALEQALKNRYDLILLDVMLPGLSGFEILRQLRAAQVSSQVIMLTSRSSEVDKVLGFELGVDDYVTKPFSVLELLGRIGAVLRRAQPVASVEVGCGRLCFGPITVDLERYCVEGNEVRLPAKGFELLKFLASKKGQVVTRDQLMDEVWGAEESITLRTLNNLVVKIRQAIEANPEQPQFLKTIHGVGYRLDL